MGVPTTAAVTGIQRIAAAVALVAGVATVLLAVTVAIVRFPSGLGVLACVLVAVVAAWFGLVRVGTLRMVGIAVAVLALLGVVALLFRNNGWPYLVGLVIGVAVWHAASRIAFRVHVRLPAAEPPRQPVLFINPWSGGGKAAKVGLTEEAAQRGIRSVELHKGDDLRQLVHDAVAAGADGLAAAGGDGTQAIVATAAAEHGLPFACIPAGTRNHFALDLGVDRDDVVGALDAFVDGGEHVVDLGEVNGRVFVNNVSMGLYAEAVQSKGYRNAKIRTLLDTVPTVFGPSGSELDLQWASPTARSTRRRRPSWCRTTPTGSVMPSGPGPGPGSTRAGSAWPSSRPGAAARTGGTARRAPFSSNGRPRTSRSTSARPVPLGIDGEAVMLDPPVRFRIRPRHVARTHLPPTPRCVAIGDAARSRRRRSGRADHDRVRSAAHSEQAVR